MGLIAKTYDLSAVICTVGLVVVGGYAEDGGLEFEQSADVFDVSVGATGLTTASKINNTDMIVTITVMESSAAYLGLGAALKLQENTPFVVVPIPFFMRDNINGDQIATATAFFLTRPNMSKGRLAGERQFKLHLPGAAIGALYGIQNLV